MKHFAYSGCGLLIRAESIASEHAEFPGDLNLGSESQLRAGQQSVEGLRASLPSSGSVTLASPFPF